MTHSNYLFAANTVANPDDKLQQEETLPVVTATVNRVFINDKKLSTHFAPPFLDNLFLKPTNQIKVNNLWQLSPNIVLNNYFIHRQSQWDGSANEPVFAYIKDRDTLFTPNELSNVIPHSSFPSKNEAFSLGSELSLHHLLNNQLILGINFQITLKDENRLNSFIQDDEFSTTSFQQLNTYAKYQIRDNFDLHLDWVIQNSEQSKTSNSHNGSHPANTLKRNDIYYHYLLFSMSYKM
ncbi:hypothetical protein [Shewanella aestuarii]|uniref:Uncharacterized protein n=1 Tax=Shewanella aestuarii TaxID=1028752 RepID=A0A6G9QJ86_9GAMM|nr:hypothetical protein [Shewanella aestuarii]QIR14127.1 hypothetical protein HBH39_06195 [Shewanella aestuarii]